jgi:hypothetical protein
LADLCFIATYSLSPENGELRSSLADYVADCHMADVYGM